MRDENFITVQGWMVNRLGLSGNELLVYASIYGFSQDGDSSFYGSVSFLADNIGASRGTANNCLISLVKKGLIVKSENKTNGIRYCTYKADLSKIEACSNSEHPIQNLDSVCAKFEHGGCAKFEHNNKEYINNNKNTPYTPQGGCVDSDSLDAIFDAFWNEYPRHVAKPKAKSALISKLKSSKDKQALITQIISAIANQKQSDQWTKDNGKFIPHPATWLNQERWNDDVEITTCNDSSRIRADNWRAPIAEEREELNRVL